LEQQEEEEEETKTKRRVIGIAEKETIVVLTHIKRGYCIALHVLRLYCY
jgi:hypothetical protein